MSLERRSLVFAALTAPIVLGSCYSFAEPSFHPGDARDVMVAIARRGVDVTSSTAGGSACDDPGLVPNAMHLRAVVPSDPVERDIWIYSFRERSWGTSQGPVDACQTAFQTTNPEATVTRIDIPTFRAFGADWSTELADAVEAGLTEASEAGRVQ